MTINLDKIMDDLPDNDGSIDTDADFTAMIERILNLFDTIEQTALMMANPVTTHDERIEGLRIIREALNLIEVEIS